LGFEKYWGRLGGNQKSKGKPRTGDGRATWKGGSVATILRKKCASPKGEKKQSINRVKKKEGGQVKQ